MTKLNRYKVRLIKKYDFDLDGRSENDIREQVDYIMTQTKILEIPDVRKTIRVKIKKIHKKEINNEENY